MSLLNNILMGSQGAGMFGRGMGLGGGRGGVSPLTLALLGTLAYRTMKGKGRLADLLGTSRPTAPQKSVTGAQAPPSENAMGLPGDLLSPTALSEGLSRLINRFRVNGHAAEAESWVGKGANDPIDPPALEQALGAERISWLMEQTGMSKEDLLAGLSKTLPEAVDQLTPDGKVPSEQDARRLLQ